MLKIQATEWRKKPSKRFAAMVLVNTSPAEFIVQLWRDDNTCCELVFSEQDVRQLILNLQIEHRKTYGT